MIPIEPIITAIIIVGILLILMSGYVKAPPDKAYIISGFRKKPKILIGRAGIKVPFLERMDTLYLGQMTVDIKTEQSVPTTDFINVNVDAVAKVRISPDGEGIEKASRNFLNKKAEQIAMDLQDSLQGNMREIIGTLTLKDYNKYPNSLSYRNVAAGCTICINRELLLRAFADITPDQFVMHDWWLMLVAAYLGKIIYIDKPLMQYRQHGNNVLGADNNNYIGKAQKYLKNFRRSIHDRKTQAELCQTQMRKLRSLAPHDTRLLNYFSIMSKPPMRTRTRNVLSTTTWSAMWLSMKCWTPKMNNDFSAGGFVLRRKTAKM